jgi:hypothetical protein
MIYFKDKKRVVAEFHLPSDVQWRIYDSENRTSLRNVTYIPVGQSLEQDSANLASYAISNSTQSYKFFETTDIIMGRIKSDPYRVMDRFCTENADVMPEELKNSSTEYAVTFFCNSEITDATFVLVFMIHPEIKELYIGQYTIFGREATRKEIDSAVSILEKTRMY